ncbi:hypothetical protein KY329_05450, partial [Candidatus Woesearchaeota archaeon]|nr:hypothetical protein [Candidatus Woesearchaeota archaeon]
MNPPSGGDVTRTSNFSFSFAEPLPRQNCHSLGNLCIANHLIDRPRGELSKMDFEKISAFKRLTKL